LKMGPVPADFIDKWYSYGQHFMSVNWYAVVIGIVTVLIIIYFPKITLKVPGSLVALVLATLVVKFFHIPVDTIGSRFGKIPSSFPSPVFPHVNWIILKNLIRPAFTIAILGGIESLLSAAVADGMIGGNHRSNMELVAQGAANIGSAIFGGIPATGAIARTATNVKSGGRTPVAGLVHALTLLIIMVLAGSWASYIPMCSLAGILVIVAYNMSEYQTFIQIIRGSRNDAIVLVTTFLLTVFVDLTFALEAGMVLAVFLFMRKMIQISNVSVLLKETEEGIDDPNDISKYKIPVGVEVFELNGPFFFGVVYKFKDSIKLIEKKPKVLIIRMRNVPVIDATGLHSIEDLLLGCNRDKTRLILSGLQPLVYDELLKSRLLFKIGKRYVVAQFENAIRLAAQVIKETE
jgi:sulfate permease, SulP family